MAPKAQEKPGALERYAISFLRERLKDTPAQTDPAYVLSNEERAQINRVVSGTMWRVSVVGMLCAAAAVAIEIWEPGEHVAVKWTYLILASVITALIEMFYIYWKHLDAVSTIAKVTGIESMSLGKYPESAIAEAIARAALELPDPLRAVDGVDPQRESPRWLLALGVLVYKLKYSASNFLFKLLIRRLATRGVIRTYAPLVGVPLAAFWNSYTSYRVLREARMRAVGPSAIAELHRNFLAKFEGLSEDATQTLFRAVAVAMVRKRAAHPNLVALFRSLEIRYGRREVSELDSTEHFLQALKNLSRREKDLALTVLQVAAALDGSISTREEEFLQEAREIAGFSKNLRPVQRLMRAFVHGKPISAQALEAL